MRPKSTVSAKPDQVWAAIQDIGALHTRLVPGFVVSSNPAPELYPSPMLSSQLGFAGAWVTPSGISTQGSFSAHQICRLGATQLGSSSVPALMNAIAPYAWPWL